MNTLDQVVDKIVFSTSKEHGLSPDIFSSVAENAAKLIRQNKNANKPAQIRKYYDELIMWNEKVNSKSDDKTPSQKYNEMVPFIKMLKAKVAYAYGRQEKVDNNYLKIFNKCIDEINSAETLKYAKLFMEAVMGYAKFFETK